jgi:hypothetical protein
MGPGNRRKLKYQYPNVDGCYLAQTFGARRSLEPVDLELNWSALDASDNTDQWPKGLMDRTGTCRTAGFAAYLILNAAL